MDDTGTGTVGDSNDLFVAVSMSTSTGAWHSENQSAL